MKSRKLRLPIIIAGLLLVASGCEVFDTTADPDVYQGPNKIKFTNSSATLFAEADTDVQSVTVNVLKPVGSDVTYDFVVDTDNSTAVEGTHYTLGSTSVTIPEDSTIGTIDVTLIKANLADPQTLTLRLATPDTAVFNNEITLTLIQFTPYDQADFVGTYDMVYEWWFEDTNVRTVTAVAGSNENEIILQDPIGSGIDWPVTMDDSDKTSFTASVDILPGWVSGTYGDIEVVGSGPFSASDLTITMDFTHCVPGVGCFGGTPNRMILTKQ